MSSRVSRICFRKSAAQKKPSRYQAIHLEVWVQVWVQVRVALRHPGHLLAGPPDRPQRGSKPVTSTEVWLVVTGTFFYVSI